VKAIDYAGFSIVLVAGVGVGHYVAKAVHDNATPDDERTLLAMGALCTGAAGLAYLLSLFGVEQKTVADVVGK
jgi:hypothetical protein